MAALVLVRHRGRAVVSALVSFVAVGVLMAPWAPVIGRLAGTQLGQGQLPAGALGQLVLDAFLPQFLGPGSATLVGGVLVAVGLFALRRPHLALGLGLWLVLPIAIVWAAQPGHFVAGRHLAFVLPVLLLVLAHGLAATAAAVGRLAARLGGARPLLPRLAAAAVGLVLLGAWSVPSADALREYYRSRQGFDWRAVAGVLDRVIPAGTPVAATAGAAYPLRHYWRMDVEVLDAAALATGSRPRQAFRWIVAHEGWDRPAELDRWLGRHAVRVGQVPPSWSLPGVTIYRVTGAGR